MENTTQKGHPRGLYLLFTTEMWERFSYYGMRAIFVLFLTEALLFDKETASGIYGSYTSLVYLTPIIGGYFADNIWGNRKSIMVGGIMMAFGQFFMFLSASMYQSHNMSLILMVVGLTALIFGNGFFKPNISTLVGQLYSEADKRKDSAYTIFYMGINLGAFIAPLLCGGLGERYDEMGNAIPSAFKWGFLMACFGMIISVITFKLRMNKLLVTPEGIPIGDIPNKQRLQNVSPEIAMEEGGQIIDDTIAGRQVNAKTDITDLPKAKNKNNIYIGVLISILLLVVMRFFVFITDNETVINMVNNYISALIVAITFGVPLIIILDPTLNKVEKQRIGVIYIVAFFVIFFWAAFEQAGASLTFFAAEQTNRDILGFSMPASWFNSFNAVFIVILAPVISILWTKLSKRGKEPASPYKQAYGLFLLALGYVFIAFGVDGVEPGVKVSIVWLSGLYLIHTIGELFLSPIGLSMVNKLAPVRFASILMGVWFLSTALANNFAGYLSSFYPDPMLKGEQVRMLEKEYTTPEHTVYLLADDLSKATAADTAKILDDKGKEVEVSYSNLNFSRLFPETKDKKQLEIQNEIIQKEKINYAKLAVNKEKSFAGMKIVDLKSFFWLFVYLAGGAAIILFLLSRLLVKMMHGVR